MIDCFTKRTEPIAIPDQEAKTVVTTFVNEIACRFVTPLQVHSDQGQISNRNFSKKCVNSFELIKLEPAV